MAHRVGGRYTSARGSPFPRYFIYSLIACCIFHVATTRPFRRAIKNPPRESGGYEGGGVNAEGAFFLTASCNARYYRERRYYANLELRKYI